MKNASKKIMFISFIICLLSIFFINKPEETKAETPVFTGIYKMWAEHSKMPLPRTKVKLIESVCPGPIAMPGCAIHTKIPTIYVSGNVHERKRVFFHELGHVVHMTEFNKNDTKRVKTLLNYDPMYEEVIAEAYYVCSVGEPRQLYINYPVEKQKVATICQIIRTAIARPKQAKDIPSVPQKLKKPKPKAKPPKNNKQKAKKLRRQQCVRKMIKRNKKANHSKAKRASFAMACRQKIK